MNRRPSPSRMPGISRRKALTVMAAGIGLGLPASGLLASAATRAPTLEWRGRALGAPARVVLRHRDEARAQQILSHCVAEIDRLEKVFSLYRADSELCRLNRDRRLDRTSLDLRLVLSQARRFGEQSDGAFDVTIQPLWRLYEAHFAARPDSETGPDRRQLERTTRLVDYRGIDLRSGGVRLAREGMAVSLNGIAQGYFTDRIADLLRDAGMADVLVDLGEIRATGSDDAGSWRIAIEDPSGDRDTAPAEYTLRNAAVATSGGYGTRFDRQGRFHHLFDPASGGCPASVLSATAFAPTAMQADALATALAVSPPDTARAMVGAFRGTGARLILADGRREDVLP